MASNDEWKTEGHKQARRSIINMFGIAGGDIDDQLKELSSDEVTRLANVLVRPDLNVRYSPSSEAINISTGYGSVILDTSDLKTISAVYVNGQRYNTKDSEQLGGMDEYDVLKNLVGSYDDVVEVLGDPVGKQYTGRSVRRVRKSNVAIDNTPFEEIQQTALDDFQRAGITYDNIMTEMTSLLKNLPIGAGDVMTELHDNQVDEEDIPHFLVYESQYNKDIISKLYNYTVDRAEPVYNYEEVARNDDRPGYSFIGELVDRLGHDKGFYDREQGVLMLQEDGYERKITNLPNVDEHWIFHNKDISYIPYYIGYFETGADERAERLRVIDPVEDALTGVCLQYDLTKRGDIKFKTILDVTRNLPDFENHPYGQEILDTLRRKVVLSSKYHETNSLLSDYLNKADDLGAVALTMLDEEAEGRIDPYGTSNGRNLGSIFYLAYDAKVEADGSITPGESKFSSVGQLLYNEYADRDNFNRNQMSFNAFLTSKDVQKRNVFIGEFGFWNMEDAIVLTNDLGGTAHVGDKMMDFHGNKSTISVILSDLSDEEIKERHLEQAVQFAKDNPNVDIIASPSSIASRLNMGIIYEGLNGSKTSDVKLPDGTIIKDGQIELTYMQLQQTAEHKSKDYAIEGDGRKYSTLLRFALTSKVGDLYEKGLLNEDVYKQHVDEAASTFQRLGVSFVDNEKLIEPDNVNLYVDAPVTVDMQEFSFLTPAAIRIDLMKRMEGNTSINIDLGDIGVESRLYDGVIKDSQGRNVLPISIPEGATIPYRYMDLFTEISRGNEEGIKQAYKNFSDVDYGALTQKNNILKDIKTMTYRTDARTSVIVPDPSLGLTEVRSNVNDTRVICHRDPAIQSGNAMSMINVGGAAPNVLHVNPLMINMQDGDFDGDTEGENAYKNLALTPEEKDEFFNRSNVIQRINYYGDVHLGTDSSYFKALCKVNDIDTSDITFADGKSSEEIARLVEDKTRQILDSPKSYGAYAISFTDEQTAKDSLCKMADDGIKGNRADMERYLEQGYTEDENRNIAKALLAKSEWTGLAGAVTNKLISNLGDEHPEILSVALDVTYTMTQSTLQMKKNADKLDTINEAIQTMKKVMDGRFSVEESRETLKTITEGLIPPAAIDEFVDKVEKCQVPGEKFGYGVINNKDMSTMKLSYTYNKAFENAIQKLGTEEKGETI